MTFDKPIRPTKQPSSAPQKTNLATQKVAPNPVKKVIPNIIGGGGNSGNSGNKGGSGGGGNGGNNQEPSPWLMGESPKKIDPSASFVEYLRWMRSIDGEYKEATKNQILQMAVEGGDYSKLLQQRNDRTKKIAASRQGEAFPVTCTWRIRVGGHRGPESILLPSFDSRGLPYIPSSTLTGLARNAAIREFMSNSEMLWKEAEKAITPYFGSIDAKDYKDKAGKVIFLDAYPMPNSNRKNENAGLAMDMANSIGQWEGDGSGLKPYKPNPNSFLSLKDVTFQVGICRMASCDHETFTKVQRWLIQGLKYGVGSQVNSGYGEMLKEGEGRDSHPFLEIDFDIEGQCIHGNHLFNNTKTPFKIRDGKLQRDKNGKLIPDTRPEMEVRSTSFKNVMRYWFRVFSLGTLPPKQVKELESIIFGAIEPKAKWGYLCVRVEETEYDALQSGILKLYKSQSLATENMETFEKFCKSLTWLAFRLGGVGQGARRPFYERSSHPRIRGCKLTPLDDDLFWQMPDNPRDFKGDFKINLINFYQSLGDLANISINYQNLRNTGDVSQDHWKETADSNCKIFVFRGNSTGRKHHALEILHQDKDKNLIGSTSRPSPVWISDAEDKEYQVVTVFGATQEPRKAFVNKLINGGAIQVFPIT
jgi:CRISPR-associated protein Cmr6